MKNNLIGISGKIGSGKDTVGRILQYLDWENSNGKCEKEFNEILPNGIFVPKGVRGFTSVFNESSYQIKKFADKLKDIVCLLIGCTREQLEDREFKEKELGEEWWRYKIHDGSVFRWATLEEYNKEGKYQKFIVKLTPRKLLQLLGTECGRQIIHPNIWVNSLFADYTISDLGKLKLRRANNQKAMAHAMNGGFKPNWIITDVRFPNEAKAIKDRGGIVIRVEREPFEEKVVKHFGQMPGHPSETALDDYEFDYVIDNNGSISDLVDKVKQLKLV